MTNINLQEFGQRIEALLKGLTLISKLAILVGGICISAYSLRIGHFPQGLSIGDGVLFMLAAACFGMVYLFFVGSLVSLGVVMSPLIKFGVKAYLFTYKFRSARKPNQVYEFAKIGWIHGMFSIFAISTILLLGRNNENAYWNLPLLAVAMYFCYSTYSSAGEKIKELRKNVNSLVQIDSTMASGKEKLENLWKAQVISLGMMLAMPVFVSGVTGQLLDAAMRGAHIRIEKSNILVKTPYSALLPAVRRAKKQVVPEQYVEFENLSVLFTGLGTATVVSFIEDGKEKQLEIPNDSMILR
jgi:hypothetical protein